MEKIKVGFLAGSVRKGSYSRAVAKALIGFLPNGFEAELVDIAELSMYNQDYDDEGRTPAGWEEFRAKIHSMDAFIFITPEYNRSVPPLLKNAIDIASRPYGSNAWGGKPAAVVSVSTGPIGGFGANHHLRQVAAVLNMYTMQQPEAYLGGLGEQMDENGVVTSEGLNEFLQKFAVSFVRWTGRFTGTK